MASRPSERIAVGYITRTKGVRGEVKVEALTHRLDRFDELSAVVLQKDGQEDRPLQIERWRPEGPRVVMKFVGIDTPEKAREILVRGYLTIDPHQIAPLPEDMYYVFELVGCTVADESGHQLGTVAEVLQMPSTDVYVVRDGRREVLIPAVGEFIVDISIPRRQLVVRGVEGLLEGP